MPRAEAIFRKYCAHGPAGAWRCACSVANRDWWAAVPTPCAFPGLASRHNCTDVPTSSVTAASAADSVVAAAASTSWARNLSPADATVTAPVPLDTDSILSQLLRLANAGDKLDSLLLSACFHLSVTSGDRPVTSFSSDDDTAALATPPDSCGTPASLPDTTHPPKKKYSRRQQSA